MSIVRCPELFAFCGVYISGNVMRLLRDPFPWVIRVVVVLNMFVWVSDFSSFPPAPTLRLNVN